MAPPLLTLQDIHLTFGGTPLLEGVELSVSERERVCLVGRNGSGKSTLLKIVAGRIQPHPRMRLVRPAATTRSPSHGTDLPRQATAPSPLHAPRAPRDRRHPRPP